MSSVDEIMGAIQQAADAMDDCLDGSLRDLIAAAIADARREAAEQMREACADRVEVCDQDTDRWEYAEHIRALPLPTGQRQAVLLTDADVLGAMPDCHGTSLGKTWLLNAARAIEAAVLAANGLETK